MNDLIGGYIDFMCDQTTTALAQVAGGKIKAIAALRDRPLPQLPAVATAASDGYDGNIRAWNAIFAPARTPPQVIGPLNDALRAAIADAALARQMQAVGVDLADAGATGAGRRVGPDRARAGARRAGAQGAWRVS